MVGLVRVSAHIYLEFFFTRMGRKGKRNSGIFTHDIVISSLCGFSRVFLFVVVHRCASFYRIPA